MDPVNYSTFIEPVYIETLETSEVSKRSGALWECIGRTGDLFGGYRYNFRLRSEYDDVTSPDANARQSARLAACKKRLEISPAGEYLASEIRFLTPSYRYIDQLNRLGYEMKSDATGVYLTLPDRESFLARWQILQQSQPELPTITVVCHPGIADDKTFIESFCRYDVLLSSEKEFVHDHFAHLIRTVILIFTSGEDGNPTYKEDKEQLVRLVKKAYQPLLQADDLKSTKVTSLVTEARKELARQVDLIWARQDYEESEEWQRNTNWLSPIQQKIDQLAKMANRMTIR
jgi:hypothetical protein